MGLTGWFGVEAARGKRFKFCLIKLLPVPDVPGAGDYGRHPVIAMGVRCNLRMRWHAKHNCVHTRLIRITFEDHSLNSSHPGTACARIPVLWKLVLGGSKTPFPEVAREPCDGRCSNLR